MTDEKSTVLVWRYRDSSAVGVPNSCLMCRTELVKIVSGCEYEDQYSGLGDLGVIYIESHRCPLCGWDYTERSDSHGYLNTVVTECFDSVLRPLDINSDELRIAELGTHLRRNAERLYTLSPTQFEKLVAGVLTDHGFKAVHTGRSGDGGADIVLFGDGGGRYGIVECKRYSKQNRVGVEILRSLVGAAVDWEVRRAYLVTTSTFTAGTLAKAATYKDRGYEIELIEASELLTLLSVYNEALPSLDHLDERTRREIIEWNRRKWKEAG